MSTASLSFGNVSHWFGNRRALNDVSLEVFPGEIVAMLGANGCGKSTLLRIASGTLRASQGSVSACGPCGYVSQKFALYEDLRADENIRFFAQACGVSRAELDGAVDESLATFEFAGRRSQPAAALSQGWRQKLKLAVALVHNPPILLLDEASAGIDPASRAELWPILRARADSGGAVLLATHHMDEAEKCNRVAYLQDGCLIFSGTPEALRQRARETFSGNPSFSEAMASLVGAACRE